MAVWPEVKTWATYSTVQCPFTSFVQGTGTGTGVVVVVAGVGLERVGVAERAAARRRAESDGKCIVMLGDAEKVGSWELAKGEVVRGCSRSK